MSAALCETFSREMPVIWISSFWFFAGSTSTPGCIVTLRTIFSPMKFLPALVSEYCPLASKFLIFLFLCSFREAVVPGPFTQDLHVPDLNLVQSSLLALLNVDVDGKMRIYVSHLVLVALGNTDDQVVNDCPDSP